MDLLFAKCNLFLTDCVIGEMEKLGQRYAIALRIAKDERFGRLKCDLDLLTCPPNPLTPPALHPKVVPMMVMRFEHLGLSPRSPLSM
jgi:hypothetical protein